MIKSLIKAVRSKKSNSHMDTKFHVRDTPSETSKDRSLWCDLYSGIDLYLGGQTSISIDRQMGIRMYRFRVRSPGVFYLYLASKKAHRYPKTDQVAPALLQNSVTVFV